METARVRPDLAEAGALRDRVRDCAGNLGKRRSSVEGAWIQEAVTCGVRFCGFLF
jgi:hypothetical protein